MSYRYAVTGLGPAIPFLMLHRLQDVHAWHWCLFWSRLKAGPERRTRP